MDDEVLLNIGQLAKICNVTHKTLRYYDALGILKPTMVNPENGYRFYSKWHTTRVMTIKQLQDIGISLSEISGILQTTDGSNVMEFLQNLLVNQENEIDKQIQQLLSKKRKLKSIQQQCNMIKEKIKSDAPAEIMIKTIHPRQFIFKPYQGEYRTGIFREYYKEILDGIVHQGADLSNICSSPLAIYDQEDKPNMINLKIGYEVKQDFLLDKFCKDTLSSGTYACYIHEGNYDSLRHDLYEKLYSDINKNGYKATGPSVEIYYINEVITSNAKNFITEIQIPIKNII